MTEIKSITLIGAGNVADQLGPALMENGYRIDRVFSRTSKPARDLAKKLDADPVNDVSGLRTGSDLYIFALKDEAIQTIANQLNLENCLAVHTSGTTPLSALEPCSQRTGVMYPLQTFTKNRPLDWQKIPIFLEAAHQEDLAALEKVARRLSPEVYPLKGPQREKLHLAAIMINNFPNYLYGLAKKILEKDGLSLEVLRPLAEETVQKAFDKGPVNAQTGPAKRGDWKTIEKHLDLIYDPEIREIYRVLQEKIFQQK